jgi:arsenate reductase
MAEGLLRHEGGERFDVASAGTQPSRVRPEAIQVMRELGIDISGQRSKSVEEFIGQDFDDVITVCDTAGQSCPAFPGRTTLTHWSIEEPAAEGDEQARLVAFHRVRDELRERLRSFIAAHAKW